MPVADEKNWVHIRLRRKLADELRVIAEQQHRYGIQVEANLAVETYIRKSKGMVVYGIFKDGRCIYVGATNAMCDRVRHHRKTFGSDCRIEIFDCTNSFNRAKQVEYSYIKKFKEIGQADFNTAEFAILNPGLVRIQLKHSDTNQYKRHLRDDGR